MICLPALWRDNKTLDPLGFPSTQSKFICVFFLSPAGARPSTRCTRLAVTLITLIRFIEMLAHFGYEPQTTMVCMQPFVWLRQHSSSPYSGQP